MEKDVLVVLDMQIGYVNARAAHVVLPIAAQLKAWLDSGGLAIVTKFVNPPGSNWEKYLHWDGMRTNSETALLPEVQSIVDSAGSQLLVIERNSFSALTDGARQFIANHGVTRLMICGVDTDSGVLKTAIDAFEIPELEPIVLIDLVASHTGPVAHQMGLTLLSLLIGHGQLVGIEADAVRRLR